MISAVAGGALGGQHQPHPRAVRRGSRVPDTAAAHGRRRASRRPGWFVRHGHRAGRLAGDAGRRPAAAPRGRDRRGGRGEDTTPPARADGDPTLLPLYLDPNTKLFLVALMWCRPWLIDPARSTPLPRTPEIARAALEVTDAHHEIECFDSDPAFRDRLSARVGEHLKVLRRKIVERGLVRPGVRLSDEVAVGVLIETGIIAAADLARLSDPAWCSRQEDLWWTSGRCGGGRRWTDAGCRCTWARCGAARRRSGDHHVVGPGRQRAAEELMVLVDRVAEGAGAVHDADARARRAARPAPPSPAAPGTQPSPCSTNTVLPSPKRW